MSYHISNLGINQNACSVCDIDGYVPTEETGPYDLNYDHGSESTHDEEGELTEYGVWWEDEKWEEKKAEALKWTAAQELGTLTFMTAPFNQGQTVEYSHAWDDSRLVRRTIDHLDGTFEYTVIPLKDDLTEAQYDEVSNHCMANGDPEDDLEECLDFDKLEKF